MKNPKQNAGLLIVSMLIVGSIVYLQMHKPIHLNTEAKDVVTQTLVPETPLPANVENQRAITRVDKAKKYQKAKELVDPTGFINTTPFTLSDLVGKKVILLDFWTYSCINCQRTLPYLEMWNEKYKDKGLVIVGIHTPEFDFEKNYDNVLSATKRLGVTYPVVLDSNMGTWNAYDNQYWPHEYLIDIDGYVVHDKIGEGDYADTEKAIQSALIEREAVLGLPDDINTTISNPGDAISISNSQVGSPETYFGTERNQYLGNGTNYAPGIQTLTIPSQITQNNLYLGGSWDFTDQYAESTSQTAGITYKYNSKNVYFVASSANGVKVKILLDGQPISQAIKGTDVDAEGYVTIKENRLYNLISGSDYGEHTLEMQVESPGLDAYTFTFG